MRTAKSKTAFVCNQCGQEYSKWQGKCTNCGVWDSVVEFRTSSGTSSRAGRSAAARADTPVIVPIASCEPGNVKRIRSKMGELDRVLGGGLVPGSVTLLGGEPGIGKSTLLLQLLAQWGRSGRTVVYVTGEESLEQVSLRAHRLGLHGDPVLFLADTMVDRVCTLLDEHKPAVVVIDSIQTMMCEEIESTPGSVAQVRESAAVLLRYAKQRGVAVLLVGHVTKDGSLAGPRLLEHMVDTVLGFEGDANYQYRILRALKNRHGPSGEIALFTMSDRGLSEITNASDLFMLGREEPQAGSAVVAVREGTRVLVVELQALVNQTHFGVPQRVASGINPRRLSLLVAVLERHGGIMLGDHDIFFNIAGGLTVNEPAIDLGVIAALVSSFRGKPLGRTAFVGEVGLGGEVRPVNGMEARIRELAGTGVSRIVVPRPPKAADWGQDRDGVVLVKCKKVSEAIEEAMR
jgi:DNA repair protein RadA/Sms